MMWRWGWLPKDPPQHLWDNPVFDGLRLIALLLGVFLIAGCIQVLIEQRRRVEPFPLGQALRFAALALATGYVVQTELSVVGTVATPRLFVGLAALILGNWGVRSIRRKQLRDPVVR